MKMSSNNINRLSPDEKVKAWRAFDQFERGEIGGFTVLRLGDGRAVVNRFPTVIVDKAEQKELKSITPM